MLGMVLVPVPVPEEATETTALCDAEPAAPLHVSEYLVVAVSAAVVCEPLVGSVPLQPLEAVQLVALVEDHVSVEVARLATVLGLALSVTVGAGAVTVTVADCAALPPAPVQVRVYVALAVRAPVECEPLVAWLPDQPPDATQEVAFVVDHDSVELLPLAMVLGLALKLTVGADEVTVTVADCAALPPAPVQVRV